MPFKWTRINEQTLRDNFGKTSAKEVAILIPGATRNMVIGKARRLGLVTERPQGAQPRAEGTKPKRIPNPIGGKVGNWGDRTLLAEPALDLPNLWCKPVDLNGLNGDTCRWPLDDGGYCGSQPWNDAPGGDGNSPYCAPHHRLGHKPASEHRKLRRR